MENTIWLNTYSPVNVLLFAGDKIIIQKAQQFENDMYQLNKICKKYNLKISVQEKKRK